MTAADTVKDLNVEVKRCPECGTGFGVEAAFCPFDGIALQSGTWDPTRDPLTGTVIDQRYEVIAPLGEGGMGTVYRVRHVTLDRMFAMKVLRRDLAADKGLAARFLQEARATAAIRHPAVVAISDFGTLEDGAPYFVMDLLVGETLATRMRGRGLLSPHDAAGIARKLAEALSAAHAANVVHRDLKPENVFLVKGTTGRGSGDEDVRIVDFGAAKIVGGSKLTRPGVVFGTPYYMSPEQAGGQPVDARADVYSLGVLLYEMITGAVPFEADTYMGVLTKHLFAAPPKPSERTPSGVQLGDLEAVVMKALEKDPSERYQSMTEFAAAIERAMDGKPAEAPKASPKAARPVAFTSMSTADKIERSVARQLVEEHRRGRRPRLLVGVFAAATVVIGGLAILVLEGVGPWSRADPAAASASASITASPASASSASASAEPAASVVAPAVSGTAPVAASVSAAPSAAPVVVAQPSPTPPATAPRPLTGAPAPGRPRPPPPEPKGTAKPLTDPFTGKPAPPPAPAPRPADPLDPWGR
jgi:eukaryotic-like serine/threonine-protein kinase